MSEKMSIARALVELKRLDKRLEKIESETVFASWSVGKKPPEAFNSSEAFNESVSSVIQSFNDLFERRSRIKSAIVISNAATEVSIAGDKMSVAEAIERKVSIERKVQLLVNMRQNYAIAARTVESNNALVFQTLDKNLQALYGKDSSQRIKEEDFQSISKPFLEQREWKLVTPDNIMKIMNKLEDEIDKFSSDVDVVLSESNASTFIEI